MSYLPSHSAVSLATASRDVHAEFGHGTIALARPGLAKHRVEAVVVALREALRGRPWAEPRGYRTVVRLAERLGASLLQINVGDMEEDARTCLANGLEPPWHKWADEDASEQLMPLLSDSSADVRRAAAASFGRLGSAAGASGAAGVAGLLRDVSGDARLAAVEALGRLAAVAAPHVEAVAAALRDPCPHVCARAMEALGPTRLGARAAGPAAGLLGDGDRYVRARAAASIGRLGAGAAGHAEALLPLLEDAHEDVRRSARSALRGVLGPARMLALADGHPPIYPMAPLTPRGSGRRRPTRWDVDDRDEDWQTSPPSWGRKRARLNTVNALCAFSQQR